MSRAFIKQRHSVLTVNNAKSYCVFKSYTRSDNIRKELKTMISQTSRKFDFMNNDLFIMSAGFTIVFAALFQTS